MGRSPCCEKAHTNKGAWTKEEDQRLIDYIRVHGEGCWRSLPKAAGLLRCGKSCRLRWINYLRPDLKRGNFTEEEDELIIKLHSLLGNKWSLIAGRLPGRTDNEIKNYWNTHIKRKFLSRGLDPQTHRPFNTTAAAATIIAKEAKAESVSISPPPIPVAQISLIPQSIDAKNKNPEAESVSISPPPVPVAQISLIPQSIDSKNKNPEANFMVRSSDSSIEGSGACSSGTTDDGQQEREKGQQNHQQRDQEIDLELSIGLAPFQSKTRALTTCSTAESRKQGIRQFELLATKSPFTTRSMVAPGVCLCCHLGEACSNCQSTAAAAGNGCESGGFYR
ncbi:hypothetical protein Ancab_038191 [Ancistrocladus abbreviatus]